MKSIADRINELISELGIPKNSFALKIGISSSLISQITTKKNNFRTDILQKITSAYPNLSSEWLLNGVGGMWNTTSQKGENTSMLSSENKSNIEKLKIKAYERDKALSDNPYHGLTSRQWHIVDRNREKAKAYFENIKGELSGLLISLDQFVMFPHIANLISELYVDKLYDIIYEEVDYIKGDVFDNEKYRNDIQNELQQLLIYKEPIEKLVKAILLFYKEFNKIDPNKLIENELM